MGDTPFANAPVPGSTPSRVRLSLDEKLNHVEDLFVRAALRVSEALPELSDSFLDGDRDAVAHAEQMSQDVKAAIREVEDEGFVILAREAPVGRDLRRLVALLRLATDIERSGSLLLHVSEAAHHLDPRGLPESLRATLRELAAAADEVFRAGIEAWRRRDGLAVAEVHQLDERVDQLQVAVLDQSSATDHLGEELLVLGLVARYLERIADHGVALARDVAFVVTGERVHASDED